MGWASGSALADEIWSVVRPLIPTSKRKEVAATIVGLFEDHDCDTLSEAEVLVEDSGLAEYQPGYDG